MSCLKWEPWTEPEFGNKLGSKESFFFKLSKIEQGQLAVNLRTVSHCREAAHSFYLNFENKRIPPLCQTFGSCFPHQKAFPSNDLVRR